MKIKKVIKGEEFTFYVRFIFNTMTANVSMCIVDDKPTLCIISEDFKTITLPETYTTPYITGIGRVPILKIKLNKRGQNEAKDYNDNKRI